MFGLQASAAGLDRAHSLPRAALFRVIARSSFFHGINVL